MKMIMTIIKPYKVDDVRNALTGIGIEGLTITEVKGFGQQKGQSDIQKQADYQASFLPKIKIEIAVEDSQVEDVIKVLSATANTGRIGDGKIFVYNLENVLRIRTGESGPQAL